MQYIIYKQASGAVALVIPSPEAVAQWGIMAIALKDVPEGKAFKIVNEADVPADIDTWIVSDADLTDGVGAPGNSFPVEPPAPDMSAPPEPVAAEVPVAPAPANE